MAVQWSEPSGSSVSPPSELVQVSLSKRAQRGVSDRPVRKRGTLTDQSGSEHKCPDPTHLAALFVLLSNRAGCLNSDVFEVVDLACVCMAQRRFVNRDKAAQIWFRCGDYVIHQPASDHIGW